MKKLLILFLVLIFSVTAEAATYKSGVTIKQVPNEFYGNWRVTSSLSASNKPELFKQKNIDFWNISRNGDVIKLENPFSGATQTVKVKDVNNSFIKFTKVGNYKGRTLTDEVTLTLKKETFLGVNQVKLETISNIDGKILSSDWATYNIRGEKISGTSVGE